jgi:ADP-ribose pyrophosphatase YjhB (NUDIX family)
MHEKKYPLMATDIIIEYSSGKKDGIILITRKNPPYGIAIPGGMAEYGISLEENAAKEAKEETNLEIIIKHQNPLCVNSKPERDPRCHIVSVTYVAKGYGELKSGDDAASAALYDINEIKQLIRSNSLVFDHADILKQYLSFRNYENKKEGHDKNE